MYNASPPPPGRETITIGNRRRIKVEYFGNMDVIFHVEIDQRITMIDVAYVPDLGFNLCVLAARCSKNTSDSVERIWNAHYRS